MKIPSCALKAYVLFCMHVILLSKLYIKIVQNMTISKHSVHFTVFVYLLIYFSCVGSWFCAWAFSNSREVGRTLSLVVVCGRVTVVPSFIESTGSRAQGLSSCGS